MFNSTSTKRVLVSGVFDILHPGHLYYLTEAKKLGTSLVVVVTSDGHATATKRPPLHAAEDRAKLIGALGMVDEVIIGAHPFDLIGTAKRARPDVVALGYDQSFEEAELADQLKQGGLRVKIVRLSRYRQAVHTTTAIISDSSKP